MENLDKIKLLKDELAKAELNNRIDEELILEEKLRSIRGVQQPAPIYNEENNYKEALYLKLKSPPPPRDIPRPESHSSGTNIYSTITKKTAAAEIINRNENSKVYSIVSILAPFLVLIGNLFSNWAGMLIAGACVIPAALYLYKVNNETLRLKSEYGIK